MWALGTMLYEVATRRMPYFTQKELATFRTEDDIILRIISQEVDFSAPSWNAYSDDAKDFIYRLLIREEKRRMTAAEAGEHPFLNRCVSTKHESWVTATRKK